MPSRKNKLANKFLAMWDMLGLECLIDLTELEGKQVWATLKGEPGPDYPNLQHMILRAQFNPQRHYEIYAFETDDISYDDIKMMFKETPQVIVDAIRKSGHSFYSNRANLKERVII